VAGEGKEAVVAAGRGQVCAVEGAYAGAFGSGAGQCASGFLQVGGVSLQVVAEQRAGAPVDPGYIT
jgi:hypothetical protein